MATTSRPPSTQPTSSAGTSEHGEEVVLDAEMPEARVLQHELGHLDGVLTLDRASKAQRREALRELRRR